MIISSLFMCMEIMHDWLLSRSVLFNEWRLYYIFVSLKFLSLIEFFHTIIVVTWEDSSEISFACVVIFLSWNCVVLQFPCSFVTQLSSEVTESTSNDSIFPLNFLSTLSFSYFCGSLPFFLSFVVETSNISSNFSSSIITHYYHHHHIIMHEQSSVW